ncbi:hypothetical protein TthSNM33_12990 [Thermus thermophilus]|nr:hypothetical protein TthSNM33_12990 [Thermus thermophilus]
MAMLARTAFHTGPSLRTTASPVREVGRLEGEGDGALLQPRLAKEGLKPLLYPVRVHHGRAPEGDEEPGQGPEASRPGKLRHLPVKDGLVHPPGVLVAEDPGGRRQSPGGAPRKAPDGDARLLQDGEDPEVGVPPDAASP